MDLLFLSERSVHFQQLSPNLLLRYRTTARSVPWTTPPNLLRHLLPFLTPEDGGSLSLQPQAATTSLCARSTTEDYWYWLLFNCLIWIILKRLSIQERMVNYLCSLTKFRFTARMTKYASVLNVKPRTTMTTTQWQSKRNGWKRRLLRPKKKRVLLNSFRTDNNLNWIYVAYDTKIKVISTIPVLFVNECVGPAPSVRAADPGNDHTKNQEDWRDQTFGVQHKGRIITSVQTVILPLLPYNISSHQLFFLVLLCFYLNFNANVVLVSISLFFISNFHDCNSNHSCALISFYSPIVCDKCLKV